MLVWTSEFEMECRMDMEAGEEEVERSAIVMFVRILLDRCKMSES